MIGLSSSLSIDAAPAWWNTMTERIKQTGGNFGRMWRCAGWNADKHGCSSSEKTRARAWVFGDPAGVVVAALAGVGIKTTVSEVERKSEVERRKEEAGIESIYEGATQKREQMQQAREAISRPASSRQREQQQRLIGQQRAFEKISRLEKLKIDDGVPQKSEETFQLMPSVPPRRTLSPPRRTLSPK